MFLHADDNHFGGLDQRGGRLALFQIHFAHRAGSDQRSNQLSSYRQSHLSYETADAHVDDAAHELVAPADALVSDPPLVLVMAASAVEQAVNLRLRDAVMSPGRLHRAELAMVDPLLDRRITDLQLHGGIAGTKQRFSECWSFHFFGHSQSLSPQRHGGTEKILATDSRGFTRINARRSSPQSPLSNQ